MVLIFAFSGCVLSAVGYDLSGPDGLTLSNCVVLGVSESGALRIQHSKGVGTFPVDGLVSQGRSNEQFKAQIAGFVRNDERVPQSNSDSLLRSLQAALGKMPGTAKEKLMSVTLDGGTCWVSFWMETTFAISGYPKFQMEFSEKVFWIDAWTVARTVFEADSKIRTVMIGGYLAKGDYGRGEQTNPGNCGLDRSDYLPLRKEKSGAKAIRRFGSFNPDIPRN